MKDVPVLVIAWVGAVLGYLQFLVAHWNIILSALGSIAALVASGISIWANAVRLKREQVALEEEKIKINVIKHPPCDSP